jgi:hypothetical protein
VSLTPKRLSFQKGMNFCQASLAGKDELIILSDQGENCLGLTKFQPPSSHLDCCIALTDKVQ